MLILKMSSKSFVVLFCSTFIHFFGNTLCEDIIGCGGFVKSEVEINFSLIEVKLYSKAGSLKYQTDCAPNNGYYMIPVYDKGEYVLKVEPPPGWTFEPQSFDLEIDGKNDMCSKSEDINFQFTGFGVVGKVVSSGQNVGPEGITLTLRKPGGKDIIKQTTSVTDGGFTFEKVLPGDYVVEGSHAKWKFEKASADVKVGRETGNAGQGITVHGYDVIGEVVSEGSPINGVNFVLFSEKKRSVQGCSTEPVSGFRDGVAGVSLCHAVSGKDGRFTFGSLPVGDYTLVPFYQGEHITFDVMPAKVAFTVSHGSVVLKEKFEVTGFSVSGRVLRSQTAGGVDGASVYVNGRQAATTRADGSYTLESMRPGTYKLGVIAPSLKFEDTQVTITLDTPQLPPLVASKFSACGRVVIDKVPSGLDSLTPNRKVKVLQGTDHVTEVTTNSQNEFCADLKPGNYVFRVVLSDAEIRAGLKLAPVNKDVTVADAPITNIIFSQFRATVQGKVICLEGCGAVQLSLTAQGRVDERQMVSASVTAATAKEATFSFSDVMPGKYKVSVLNEAWCWQDKAVEVEVTDHDLKNVHFTHTGYILACSLTHDITLHFEQDGKPGNVGSFELTKGVNKFCLAEPGVYKLTPESCHQFEKKLYSYDTSRPSVLTLTAIKHLVEGSIIAAEKQDDIRVTVRSSVDEQPTVLGPLTASNASDGGKSAVAAGTTYKFTYWARSGEKLELVPTSAVLLFYPPKVALAVSGDGGCAAVADIAARAGVFIRGSVTPALAGATITVTGGDSPITVETDDSGKYKVGPLHADRQYSVDAEKEGYVLTASAGADLGHFNAFKLAEINVQVLEADTSAPLPGVLLSLSGGAGYRSNQQSGAESGARRFLALSPGQYFLRPMLKEYEFSPASQMVEVAEGATVNIDITATRVAFSCYGVVTSLNGEAEAGVVVEARRRGDSGQQEESKTEADGTFRIRGLQPGGEYDISVRRGDVNQHIERTAPKVRTVTVESSDVTDVHLIAFRRINQMDLSGNVVTPDQQFLPNLKVLLFRESKPDTAIHTVKLDVTPFFFLPSLTIDDQQYMLRLESTLSRATYTYASPAAEVVFTANTTYRHFTFTFNPKPRSSVDQELSQSSVLILPLALLVICVSYNSDKVMPLLVSLAAWVQQAVAGGGAGPRPARRGATPPPGGQPDVVMQQPGATGGTGGHKAKVRRA